MLSAVEAYTRIAARIPLMSAESVVLRDAQGRVLAAPVVAGRQLPPWDNSAMDGFAVRAADLPGELPVVGTIAAGAAPDVVLPPGAALRIMTGAPMPAGADTVVMRENVDDRGDTAVFPAERAGRDVRRAGEDIALGDEVLHTGDELGPGELGVLAALGFARVDVARRPRVGVLSSGDELVEVDVEPRPGQIVNSNAYALAAQVREAGGEPVMLGIARDDTDEMVAKVREGLALDFLVTSGGVSVGDYDFVKPAFERAGVPLEFWKVAIKPGKPLAYGLAPSGAPVFGLPGNPVSSMVVFELFVRPAIRAALGAREVQRPRAPVVLTTDYRKQPGRAHYVRAALRRDGGELHATPNARQGSGMLRSMLGVDALIELPIEHGDARAGDRFEALLLRPK